MEISKVQKDVNVSEVGTWLPFGNDAAVKIAQWMNPKHRAYLKSVAAEHGHRALRGALGDEKTRELVAGQWQFVLTDFEGFTEEGNPVKWSPETVARWAANPEYIDFFNQIEEQAKDVLNYRKENIMQLGEILPALQHGRTAGLTALPG